MIEENYINPDEALLQDKNRPRDEYWFKVRHWMNTEQQDWRTANKNIDFKQCLAKGLVSLPATWWVSDTLAYFKDSYTESDLAFVTSFIPRRPDANTHPISWWQSKLKAQKRWDSWVNFKNWNIEITKTGSYIIQFWCMFQFPDWYTSSDSYLYKEYVALKQYVDKEWWKPWEKEWAEIAKTQARACSTADLVVWTHVSWADKWDILNVWFSHTYDLNNVLCQPLINIYRM